MRWCAWRRSSRPSSAGCPAGPMKPLSMPPAEPTRQAGGASAALISAVTALHAPASLTNSPTLPSAHTPPLPDSAAGTDAVPLGVAATIPLEETLVCEQREAFVRGWELYNAHDCVSFGAEGDSLTLSVSAGGQSSCSFDVGILFPDPWSVVLSEKVRRFDMGLLPLLSLLHEVDLIELPHTPGLPYLEGVRVAHRYANNDLLHQLWVTPFGPFPGADDLHNTRLFNLLETEHKCIFIYSESPPRDARTHRGAPLPPVRRRRKRNVMRGAAVLIRALPLPPPPSAPPCACASAGCRFSVHTRHYLSSANGFANYCCAACRDGKRYHDASCQRYTYNAAAPPPWEAPRYGLVDVELFATICLPVPRWLIPNALIRWAIPRILRMNYGYFFKLNDQFDNSQFAQRVREDSHGFYRGLPWELGGDSWGRGESAKRAESVLSWGSGLCVGEARSRFECK